MNISDLTCAGLFLLVLLAALAVHVRDEVIANLRIEIVGNHAMTRQWSQAYEDVLAAANRKQALIDQYLAAADELMACMQELEDENAELTARLNRTEADDVIAEVDAWLGSEAQA